MSTNQKRNVKNNDSTVYNMATDINPLTYVEKQGNMSYFECLCTTDHLLSRVTGPRVKLSVSDWWIGRNFER